MTLQICERVELFWLASFDFSIFDLQPQHRQSLTTIAIAEVVGSLPLQTHNVMITLKRLHMLIDDKSALVDLEADKDSGREILYLYARMC